jgi:hypothetical protein
MDSSFLREKSNRAAARLRSQSGGLRMPACEADKSRASFGPAQTDILFGLAGSRALPAPFSSALSIFKIFNTA